VHVGITGTSLTDNDGSWLEHVQFALVTPIDLIRRP
jgi:hypothetical protein